MKQIICKHCKAVNQHHSFQCHTQRKPIRPKVGDIIGTQQIISIDKSGSKHKVTWMSKKAYDAKKKAKEKPKPKRLEEKSVQELMKLADIVFAKWVKKRDSLTDGTFKCISCGLFKSTKEMQNGHYFSRRYSAVRYHEDNNNGECESCNCGDNNHLDGYKVNLEAKIGSERLKWLQENYNKGHKWEREELIELIKKYKV